MKKKFFCNKIIYEKYNITHTIEWSYLTYLINKNNFSNINDIRKIKLDDVSLYSITPFYLSNEIIKIMKYYFNDLKSYDITDACACIGGDTINFIKHFKHVNSIELYKLRYDFLCHNLNLFTEKNYNTYNDDCLEIIPKIKQDIIYYDLPWDGRDYKRKTNIKLKLNNLDSSLICNQSINNCKLICFKIPNNFDIDDFTTNTNFNYLKVHDLKKFKIIIMYNKID